MQENRSSNKGAWTALAVSLAAVMIAVTPVVMLVAYARPALDALSQRHASAISVGASSELPSKWSASYLLPQYFQEDRGTCWDFAAIGVLEQSYRQNGVQKGWLRPEQYVRFSPQALGISTVRACRDKPDVCDVLGDDVYHNQTTGGEVWWLYSLTELYDKLLPVSICPYKPLVDDLECPGMDDALLVNPVKFHIRSMETAYSVEDMKKLMVSKDRPLAWSSTMHTIVYYMPCSDEFFAAKPECSTEKRVRCPTDRYYNSEYCARYHSAMYNQDGEFFLHGNTISEGGHAMNVVGYNDDFVTKQGHRGGFLIKNSWHDLTYNSDPDGRGARGSHSVAYWMQKISAWNEKALCPGPLNPDNWLSCVSQTSGPTMRVAGMKRAAQTVGEDFHYINYTCLSPNFMDYLVRVTLQPTEFRCRDESFCSKDAKFRYFLLSVERNQEQDLMKICMLQHNTADLNSQKTICTSYINPSLIAYLWEPIAEQVARLQNDEDFCGYYFWPYEVAYKSLGVFVNMYANYFEIEWDPMSYAANAAKYPGRDYTLVKESTHTQKVVKFDTPSPFPKKRY